MKDGSNIITFCYLNFQKLNGTGKGKANNVLDNVCSLWCNWQCKKPRTKMSCCQVSHCLAKTIGSDMTNPQIQGGNATLWKTSEALNPTEHYVKWNTPLKERKLIWQTGHIFWCLCNCQSRPDETAVFKVRFDEFPWTSRDKGGTLWSRHISLSFQLSSFILSWEWLSVRSPVLTVQLASWVQGSILLSLCWLYCWNCLDRAGRTNEDCISSGFDCYLWSWVTVCAFVPFTRLLLALHQKTSVKILELVPFWISSSLGSCNARSHSQRIAVPISEPVLLDLI